MPPNPPSRAAVLKRAASLIAQALAELQMSRENGASAVEQELATNRAALHELSASIERHIADEREQHISLAGQLTTLAAVVVQAVDPRRVVARAIGEHGIVWERGVQVLDDSPQIDCAGHRTRRLPLNVFGVRVRSEPVGIRRPCGRTVDSCQKCSRRLGDRDGRLVDATELLGAGVHVPPPAGSLVHTHWNPVVPLGESQVIANEVARSPLLPAAIARFTSADCTKPGRTVVSFE